MHSCTIIMECILAYAHIKVWWQSSSVGVNESESRRLENRCRGTVRMRKEENE